MPLGVFCSLALYIFAASFSYGSPASFGAFHIFVFIDCSAFDELLL
jgi:hypothetical protein